MYICTYKYVYIYTNVCVVYLSNKLFFCLIIPVPYFLLSMRSIILLIAAHAWSFSLRHACCPELLLDAPELAVLDAGLNHDTCWGINVQFNKRPISQPCNMCPCDQILKILTQSAVRPALPCVVLPALAATCLLLRLVVLGPLECPKTLLPGAASARSRPHGSPEIERKHAITKEKHPNLNFTFITKQKRY